MLRPFNLVGFALILMLNVLLYCYPLFRGVSRLVPFRRPPLRMLILADPHLEGDGKISRMGWRGRLDLWGNDHYLGHIHSSMRFFTRPTHTIVLGDHMSSQWIDDVEFSQRSTRLEKRVFKWAPGEIVFNITGNHDIGYAGDMTQYRINRWKLRFGPTNFISHLDTQKLAPGSKPLRVIGLNDLHLDGPAQDEDLRGQTHQFLQRIPQTTGSTILLTHVPLHKESGLCVDNPYMSYYDYPRILLREQNHLSPESTKAVLDQIYTNAKGIVLTGHDHEGCHVIHMSPNSPSQYWVAGPYEEEHLQQASKLGSKVVEEVTVRSVMGQYGGNAGLLNGWYDKEIEEWIFQYQAVPFVHNTIWWIVNILTLGGLIYLVILTIWVKTTIGKRASERLQRMRSKRSKYGIKSEHELRPTDCE